MKATDANEFLESLNAGVFVQQLGRVLSDVACGVVEHGRQGEVTIKLTMKQIGQSSQVSIKHDLSFVEPTKRGKKAEITSLDTPMYVTENGLELFVNSPTGQMFTPEQAPVKART